MLKDNTYDAIVIGSGITGGWAAKELTEKGLKTLVLERGRNVAHIKDYPTANLPPWKFQHRGFDTRATKDQYPVQCTNYAFNESTMHFYVNDRENPFSHPENKPFRWIRGYQVGGKSLLWGRETYRFSDLDFEANLRDGAGVDWPIRYKDIAPWYDYVEKFVGISGSRENIAQLPDGQFLPPMEMNCVEQEVKINIEKHWSDRKLIMGRGAHLTKTHHGRGPCQHRNNCERGCPYGGYFSSNSATLPVAQTTGNLTMRPFSIVHSVIYDEKKDKATGVRVLDAETGNMQEFYARIIFMNASTLNTTWILLNSATPRFSDGLANSSGVLGHYLMDHHKNLGAEGTWEGYEDRMDFGYRPILLTIPRFRNVKEQHPDFIRGYQIYGSANREGWWRQSEPGFGANYKKEISKPGPWKMNLSAYGECLPYYENKAEMNHEVKDRWGLPTLKISCVFKENEQAMRKDMLAQSVEMLEVAGLKDVTPVDGENIPGFSIHEMGTARMGRDPKTSVLNKHNQCHDIPNLFITDGAAMTSSACQNPSLTYMALTARACDYAVREMKKGNL
ncbi:MAG: GMC family oxidoreductase [Cyclobacteriaceae bacterium]|nr:GMC family oxidoreductase [Cyclobacteriaceae bacterium]